MRLRCGTYALAAMVSASLLLGHLGTTAWAVIFKSQPAASSRSLVSPQLMQSPMLTASTSSSSYQRDFRRGMPGLKVLAPSVALPASAGLLSSGPSLLSGVGEALATVFASELGDKTFFLTMMLAVRRGRLFALLSSQSALWLMTGLSALIGVLVRSVPHLASDRVLVNLLAAGLMFFFGIQTLVERGPVVEEAECGGLDLPECEVKYEMPETRAENPILHWFRPAALIFLAEWGDRSMLATVTLAATRSPLGVFMGGVLGHLGAASLAVASGGLLDKFISERMLKTISGCLFLTFGLTTLLGVY
eukprot:gb/GFBE01062063.1/.p1 GENE.gb/GFBE01062063.1/~~gb/GFBE01062063.1/.p1  ORF type:complete len:305 (+),score=48.76 gb/GFBE01062063.1/:1-915(+)